MLSKSQALVYEAIVTRLNKIVREHRSSDLSSDELQNISLWVDGLNLEDNCIEISGEPRYATPNYINGSPVIQMMTMMPSHKIMKASKESIDKAKEISEMSDEEIMVLAKQMGIKF